MMLIMSRHLEHEIIVQVYQQSKTKKKKKNLRLVSTISSSIVFLNMYYYCWILVIKIILTGNLLDLVICFLIPRDSLHDTGRRIRINSIEYEFIHSSQQLLSHISQSHHLNIQSKIKNHRTLFFSQKQQQEDNEKYYYKNQQQKQQQKQQPNRSSSNHSDKNDVITTDKTNYYYEQRRKQSLDVGYNPLLSLNLNLDALARANAAERAQELYQRINALYDEGYYACGPDIVSFNSVLKAWQSNPIKALEFWENVMNHDNGNDNINQQNSSSKKKYQRRKLQPNVRSYNTFLLSLANNGMYEQAESLLRQMLERDSVVLPDQISYNTVLLACAVNGSYEATERAEIILHEMLSSTSTTSSSTSSKTTSSTANNDDTSYSSSSSVTDEHYQSTAKIYLQEMLSRNYSSFVQPDTTSFNTVILALSNQKTQQAAGRADYWLQQMKKLPGHNQKPDVYTYTTVIQAWARCVKNNEVGSKRVMELLHEMETKKSHDRIRPNSVTYTLVIEALCHNKQPEKAQEIMDSLINNNMNGSDLSPDVVTFSVLIDGWKSVASERPDESVDTVFQLLKRMLEMKITPNERTYTSVFKVLSTSKRWDAGPIAEKVLEQMIRISGTMPSTIHYNAVLDCYAKSKRATKAIDGARLWKDKIKSFVSSKDQNVEAAINKIDPDIITYNTLLNCAANACGSDGLKRQSLQVGFEVYNALMKDPNCHPTSLTYNYMFKIIRRLLSSNPSTSNNDTDKQKQYQHDQDRKTYIEKIFRSCCEHGCLNDVILQQHILSLDDAESLLQLPADFICRKRSTDSNMKTSKQDIQKLTLQDLPSEWSRNAMADRKRTKQ